MEIKDSAKTIVCYGDSNTWGAIPCGDRYPRSMRWVNILQKLLGVDYELISEGLCGRTFVAVNPDRPYLTGITHLDSIIKSHEPDIMIVMLGTNDVKDRYNLNAEKIVEHLSQTIELIQKYNSKILVICPPEIVTPSNSEIDSNFTNGFEVSKELPVFYKTVAEKYSCNFINAQDYISSSKIDGYHLDAEEHVKLANVIKEELLKMI